MKETRIERTGERGLTEEEVLRSRQIYGANRLTEKGHATFIHTFLESFGDPIIKILLAALALNLLFLFRESNWFEAVGIALAVFLATFVSALSEYGSESAFLKMQEEAARCICRVRRDGKISEIPVEEAVVGDIVLLQAGERVPADGVLIRGVLAVDQSALNGESREQEKTPSALTNDGDFYSESSLFRGSVVCSGEGIMRIETVGDRTFYGGIAGSLQEEGRESPLRLRLTRLAEILSRIGYAAAVCVAGADLFNRIVLDNGMDAARILADIGTPSVLIGHLLHALTLAVTVVVVAVPEGLPMMITVVLSANMSRMVRAGVLVRRLVGIETSGSLNILFTDKTGTLTRGALAVDSFVCGTGRIYTPDELRELPGLWEPFCLSALYNTGSTPSGLRAIGGNATDRALMQAALPADRRFLAWQVEEKVSFDSRRKYSSAVVEGTERIRLIKGAPELILPRCALSLGEDGGTVPFSGRREVLRQWEQMTRSAMRVIAVACSSARENGAWVFVGLVGMRDRLRPEVPKAVKQIREAGVQVVMITGDHDETAKAVAREAGILGAPSDLALTSTELAALDDERLAELIPRLRVVARAKPEDKVRLVRICQQMDLVVGMTGDGVNDAPALKRADVGFSMGSGAEVAREAGDIVILDDRFASIVRAVLYGRTIFKSIQKFIVFQLTMNFCAVAMSMIGPFIGVDTPVTVTQMLWVNIIMDTLAGLAFSGEPPMERYMKEPPKRRDESVVNKRMLFQVVWMGVFTVILCSGFLCFPAFKTLFHYEQNPIGYLTAFFVLFVFSGVFNSFSVRTPRMNLLDGLSGNRAFLLVMAAVSVVQIALVYFGGSAFRTAALSGRELVIPLALAFLVIPADLLRKRLFRENSGLPAGRRMRERRA